MNDIPEGFTGAVSGGKARASCDRCGWVVEMYGFTTWAGAVAGTFRRYLGDHVLTHAMTHGFEPLRKPLPHA